MLNNNGIVADAKIKFLTIAILFAVLLLQWLDFEFLCRSLSMGTETDTEQVGRFELVAF